MVSTILEMAVDSRGVTTGLQQANKAFDDTAKKADRAEREVEQLAHAGQQAGHNMSAAFAATGGGLAITHGLEGISSGLRSGNSAMAAFAASQALLDLGRFREDMKGVTEATGSATTVFGRLGAIIKAHPLMTIATVLATAASAMAVFGDDTEDATEKVDELGRAIRDATASREAQQLLGISQAPGVQAQLSAVMGATTQYTKGELQTFGQFGRALGETPEQLEARVMRGMEGGNFNMPRGATFTGDFIELADRAVPAKVAQFLLKQFYDELTKEASSVKSKEGAGRAARATRATLMGPALPQGGRAGLYADPRLLPSLSSTTPASPQVTVALPPGVGVGQPVPSDPLQYPTIGSQMYPGAYAPSRPIGPQPGGQVFSPAMAKVAEMTRQQEEDAQRAMDELIRKGQDFGATIGDAFMQVASGTMTAKNALAQLISMMAQAGMREAFAGIGGKLFGQFGNPPASTNTTTASVSPSGFNPLGGGVQS